MGKARKTADFRPLGVPMSPESHYSDDDLAKIIEAGAPLKELSPTRKRNMHAKLNRAAAVYRVAASWQNRPAASVVRDELDAIARKARELRELLSTGARWGAAWGSKWQTDDPLKCMPYELCASLESAANITAEECGGYPEFPPEPFTHDGHVYYAWWGRDALRAALVNVERLESWAKRAARLKDARVNSNAAEARRTPDEALNDFLQNSLAPIYREYISRKPGISLAEGSKGGGPWVRFMRACLEPLDQSVSVEALARRWKRIRGDKSASKKT